MHHFVQAPEESLAGLEAASQSELQVNWGLQELSAGFEGGAETVGALLVGPVAAEQASTSVSYLATTAVAAVAADGVVIP